MEAEHTEEEGTAVLGAAGVGSLSSKVCGCGNQLKIKGFSLRCRNFACHSIPSAHCCVLVQLSANVANGVVLYLAVLEGSIHPSPIAVPATTLANFAGTVLGMGLLVFTRFRLIRSALCPSHARVPTVGGHCEQR